MPDKKDLTVGLTFFIALLIMGYVTIVLGKVSIGNSEETTLRVRFTHINGLKVGSKVSYSGMKIGEVRELELTAKGIVATLSLRHSITLHKDYNIMVIEDTVLGGKSLDIRPGTSGVQSTDTVLKGTAVEGIMTAGGKLISDNREKINAIIDNLQHFTENIKTASDKINSSEGTLGTLMNDKKTAEEVKTILTNIASISTRIDQGTGAIGALVSDEDTGKSVKIALKNLSEITNKITAGKGPIARLLNDRTMGENLSTILTNTKTISNTIKNGKGTIGRLINDPTLSRRLDKFAQNAVKISDQIADGKGFLGSILNDEETSRHFKQTLANLSAISGNIKNGKGTVGKLINDDEIYMELKTMLKNLSGATEDMREQAPINTFSGAVMGAF